MVSIYKALYRKWRPQVFEDVIGQSHIVTTLKNQVLSEKVGHAYLFTGSRGTGKTTCSKILAKAVNCQNLQDGNPCLICDSCKGIEDGSILDVVEIDAASNNGVDNIRDLIEEANFTPSVCKYRVYIIDETHMLSAGAFNALLKIMEEPPSHVIFILATTEVHKVPATIISRCQRFDFKRISSEDMANRLQYVAQQEGIALDADAASLIARISDGAMRDSLSLLDQCTAFDQPISIETVGSASGMASLEYLTELVTAIQKADIVNAIGLVDKIYAMSINLSHLTGELISYFRNLMILKATGGNTDLVVCLPHELKILKAQSKEFSMQTILQIISVLSETQDRLSRTSSQRIEFEMCLVKLCNPKLDTSSDGLARRISQLEALIKNGAVSAPAQSQEQAQPQSSPPLPSRTQSPTEPLPKESTLMDVSDAKLFEQWAETVNALNSKNPALAGTLQNSKAYYKGDLMLIEANDDLFFKMMKGNKYARESIREILSEQTGKVFRLGPYPKNEKINQSQEGDPLSALQDKANAMGVSFNIK